LARLVPQVSDTAPPPTEDELEATLMTAAIARAEESGARHVNLTSRPSREAANRLYERLGFEARDTNVYRLTLS
jgi:ribosomal protein S18 acetylase RimI-like enzyme